MVEGEETAGSCARTPLRLKDEEAGEEFSNWCQSPPRALPDPPGVRPLRRALPRQGWGGKEDAAAEVYSYLLCSICPVKRPSPPLSHQRGE